ncbi:symmetrical bis(5'-nucleosyl)-tetraphosphatase [Modicisalibacter tunisiensis]|uniref:bis(5'-nucleosyl)-tetraphosphatase (symmetrical) n=1 Tax=Modicisalibacter tunisiensis TaxID=390637 RepID=A0ABS7WXK7_9GAMM|nr:symmetrical bis(5'-nucleosyl)-tetraphosphatase [Modicisalibacter tunisiensis]MBZ9566486.1 symmetrical bis(5'-nucleosyl)-tetraphosphatase [Modicisalibacter tunisiensis]
MPTYAIGDLQGCHAEFVALLERLSFDPGRDTLWIAGDLVNRGPGSLACLREVAALGDAARVVLGNHDLHLLAVARGGQGLKRKDTLAPILEAPDATALLDWLQGCPLWVDDGRGTADRTLMTHAGLLPHWGLDQARTLADEVAACLRGERAGEFLTQLYGNTPARWRDDLTGVDRLRAIVNVFTRMRFIAADGTLDFDAKEGLDSAPPGYAPWFRYARDDDPRILFGHWAALEGQAPQAAVRVEALDTGCVWGGSLTALDLADGTRVSVPCTTRR